MHLLYWGLLMSQLAAPNDGTPAKQPSANKPAAAAAATKLPLPQETIDLFEPRSVTFTGGEYQQEKFEYRLLKPAQLEPGKKYPLVLFLHGAGERGNDNIKQLLYLPQWIVEPGNRAQYPCYLIAPQCREGKRWAEVDWSKDKADPMPPLGDQMKVVLQILDGVMKSEAVDPQRVYLTGLSMGGYGSWDLGMRHPERFAAVAPVCGGGDETQAAKLKDMPVWAWHGDQDKAVPVERSRRMIEAIRTSGGKPKYTELPGVGHNSWIQAYREPGNVLQWMFEQRRKG